MIKIQDLFIYPIKSLTGINLSTAKALQRGFEFDRRWMLVDETGRFITQRVEHKLALLKAEITGGSLHISHKNLPEKRLSIVIREQTSEPITVSVWDSVVECLHLSNSVDEWFSDYLQKPCKLVHMLEDGKRAVDTKYAENQEQVSFADAFPYLLISQASLDDLNAKLETPVPMNRFRPSLVVSGTSAFEEDNWAEIKIDEVHFKVAKPCSRCILTTVDQDTGKKGTEPLRTLAKYRSFNNKVLFGQNLLALNEGVIRENSVVEVLRYK